MDARDRRYTIPWEWWDAIVIYFLWFFMAASVAAIVALAFADPDAPATTAAGVLAAVVMLVVTTLAWVGFRGNQQGLRDGIRRAFGMKRPTGRDWALGVGYGIGTFIVLQLGLGQAITYLIEVLGREVPEVQVGVQEAAQSGGVVALVLGLAVVVLGPLGEELLYRGVLYQALSKHLPGWPAIGLSGLAFGVTHIEPFVVALTFPLGMVLAWVMRRHGTLVVPVVAHVVFNMISFVVIVAGGESVG